MVARGKHEAGKGSKPAKSTPHVPKHGGPQTGNGFTAQGKKPRPEDTNERRSQGNA